MADITDILSPCKLIERVWKLFVCAVVIVFLGYVGKYVWVHGGDVSNVSFSSAFGDKDFYVPDAPFWVSLVVATVFLVLLNAFWVGISLLVRKILTFFFITLPMALLRWVCCCHPPWASSSADKHNSLDLQTYHRLTQLETRDMV